MKTEVFMGGTPGMRETTNIHSLPKTTEDPVLLLLDTPQNTPVGTPGSDIIISSEGQPNEPWSLDSHSLSYEYIMLDAFPFPPNVGEARGGKGSPVPFPHVWELHSRLPEQESRCAWWGSVLKRGRGKKILVPMHSEHQS
ncbi:hypothetical protein NPIL_534891 [Nephila pilipes]|uniref:Uncharacterized protein n=1 Tax=Nephila pilipes TaxID=299642 RepID=A0A8X6U3H4_NEPPI|nr:hypothetical protein NPIL_534891 [Nephila pilipes]